MKPIKIGTHIKCRSIEQSVKFYLALGFVPTFVYGSESFQKQFTCTTVVEKYQGVVFDINGALFEIADGHVAVKPEVFRQQIESSKISLMFNIESVDELLAICEREGITIAVSPRVFPWGTKEVVLKDPDGVVLVFREVLQKGDI